MVITRGGKSQMQVRTSSDGTTEVLTPEPGLAAGTQQLCVRWL